MKKVKILNPIFLFFIFAGAFFGKNVYACSGGSFSGTLPAITSNFQTLGGINGGEFYNFNGTAGRVYIFSFCQGGGSHSDDPQIQIMNSSGTPVTDGYNDDHCGLGSELVWVCPVNGTYQLGFFEYNCQTDGQFLGTVAYKYLPTPTRADCLGARPLCTSANNVDNLESTGGGHYYDLFNYNLNNGVDIDYDENCPDCLITGERFTNWYSFYASGTGALSFTIDPHEAQDFDWAIWDMTYMDCNDLVNGSASGYGNSTTNTFPNPISCNYCGSVGNTGASSSYSGTCNSHTGGSCNTYNAPVSITVGHNYVMVIDNFSNTTDGYNINFSGASVYDQTPPLLSSVVYPPVCGVDNVTVQFSEAVSCTSMQSSCITISGPGGTFTTDDITSQTCEASVGNTYSSGTFYDDIWTIELGDYLMDPGLYTITLNNSCATDVCGNGSTTSSTLPFTITGISATLNVVAQAGCSGQSIGSLSVTGVGGGCGYGYTYNWSNGSTATSISSLSAGTYSVTITDGVGRCEWSDQVTIYNVPPVNPTASSNSPVCAGSTLSLYGGSSTGTSYSWTGPSFSSSSEDPTTSAVVTGTYNLTVTDTYGCTASTSTLVTVNSESWDPASAAVDPTAICVGASTDLTVTPAIDPNILDYSTWAVGTGSATGFTVNGATTENYRINSTDPWGNGAVIWEARPDAVSGADGGWNTPSFAVDRTKTYRYSVWVWRNANGNGSFYLGCHGYGSVAGVITLSSGANNTNPYFMSSSNVPTAGRWELVVGHVYPYTWGGTSNHPESGRYTINDGKVANISNDYKWRTETTSGNFRTYLYYCTNTAVRQRWTYPRVDVCDGTEPTINELLNGFDPNETLGTGADWEWYAGSCGGTNVGSGSDIVTSPSSTTTYYARAEGTCGNTSCVSANVTVNTPSTAPTSIAGTTLICSSGGSTTLTAVGGTLGIGASYQWYAGGCVSGSVLGTGASLIVSPSSTTTYYVRRTGLCNTTACASVTVNLDVTSPSYVGYSNISGYQYQESPTIYWVKGGNDFSIDISHSDNYSVWRQYFGFNKDDCPPNGCGGAPNEIKSYNTDNVFSDWLADNNYIDITSANCVDGDGDCTDNDLTRRWVSNIKITCDDWDYKLNTYLYDECVKGVGYTDLGLWMKVDNTAPTHDEVTVSDNCWTTDGTNTYTITVKSTEPRSGFGGSYGIMALINYNLGEPNAGGYFAWHPSSYTHADNQMACAGGGLVSKSSGWGGSRIDLVSATTSVSGSQRTVTFTVRPHSDFIELNGGNKISMYTSDNCNNYRGWTLFNPNFTTMRVPNTPTSATVICNGASASLSTTSIPATGITYYWQTSSSGTSTTIGSGTSVVVSPTTTTTYYVRPYSLSGCWGEASLGVTVTVNSILPVSVNISDSQNPICIGENVVFTATPTNGGTPTYQWNLNGANVGSNSSTYSNTELADGDVITCVMTSSETCTSGNPDTSNPITMAVSTPGTGGLSTGDYVWSGNISNAWENSSNWLEFDGSDFSVALTKPGVDDNVFLVVYGTCVIQNPATNIGSTENCNDIHIYTSLTTGNLSLLNVYGDWANYGTFTSGQGNVKFCSADVQNVISGGDSFYDIDFNNTNSGNSNITLGDNLTITHHALFNLGIVYPGVNKVIFTSAATSDVGNVSSFVDGLVERQGAGAFTVPTGDVIVRDIGDGNTTYAIWAPLTINPAGSTTTDVEYYFTEIGLPDWWNTGSNLDATLHHVSSREYWKVSSTQNFTNATLFWNDNAHANGSTCVHSFCSGDNNYVPSDLTVAYWSGSMWKDVGGSPGGNHNAGSITSGLQIPFGAKAQTFVTFGSKDNLNPLPVDLVSFNAICENNKGVITWQTVSETNNEMFILEKSRDMINFFEVTRIKGAGTSNENLEYDYVDEKLFSGDNYYRLKQIDFDGRVTTYDAILINCDKENLSSPEMIVFPNPFTDEINVVLEGLHDSDFVIQIFDEMGRIIFVNDFNTNDSKSAVINLKELKPAMYFIRATSKDNVFNQKIIKK